jgi:hypothetical protein
MVSTALDKLMEMSQLEFVQEAAITCTLSANFVSKSASGSFKSAHFGNLYFNNIQSQTVFPHGGPIIAKRAIHKQRGKQITPLDKKGSYEVLKMDFNCLRWAHALLESTYNWIDTQIAIKRERGLPVDPDGYVIPKLRFVHYGFFDGNSDSAGSGTYLIEEIIPQSEGTFRKYINNDKPIPLTTNRDPSGEQMIALFLCFVQHQQYLKTSRMAFLSDLQGTHI